MSDVSKKARRDAAREHARELREQERKRKRRNRWLIQGGVLVAAIAVALVVVLVVQQVAKDNAPVAGPANMASDGILLQGDGSGNIVAVPTPATEPGADPVPTDQSTMKDTANITIYLDYFCPVCQAFEQANAQQIGTWVSAGVATLEYHPISFLDRSSLGTRYASRSANAAACVANYDPDNFFQVTTAFYANQPAEQTSGLTNDEIIALVEKAGVTNANVAQCIKDESFKSWVTEATARATTGPIPNSSLQTISGTPTVLVDGVQYPGSVTDATAFASFVNDVRSGTYVAPTN